MSKQLPATPPGGFGAVTPRAARRRRTPTRSGRGDASTTYEGAISLAAALGGTLLSVEGDLPRRRPDRPGGALRSVSAQ